MMIVVLPSIICTLLVLSLAFVPFLIRIACRLLGKLILYRNEHKRTRLLDETDRLEQEASPVRKRDELKDRSDEDWERVDFSVPSTGNGQKPRPEWRGIIGFFHPFWYALWCTACNSCAQNC